MTMLARLGAASVFTLLPGMVLAGDLLPLRHGIYVLADVACRDVSHATAMSFWGTELNTQREIGSLEKVEQNGTRYAVTIVLSGSGQGDILDWILSVPDRETFVIEDPAPPSAYRWCFDRMP